MPNRDRDRGDPLAEAINPVRGGTEDIVIVADDLAHRGDDLLIRRGDQAYRPIGAEHASLWAKPFQHPSHVRPELLGRPRVPVRFGHEPCELADDVRFIAQRCQRFRPRLIHRAVDDAGLGCVVDDKPDVWVPPDGDQGGGQLSRAHEEVVGKAGFAHGGDSALNFVPEQPLGIRFVVNLVADADQGASPRAALQAGDGRGHGWIGEVHPTDHPGDEFVRGRDLEKLTRLLQRSNRLDEDGPIDSAGREQWLEIFRSERPPDRGELGTHPWIVAPGRIPEMVVRVDPGYHPGVGVCSARSCSDLRSSHSAERISTSNMRTESRISSSDLAPTPTAGTAGWPSGNWIAAARRGTPWRSHTARSF